MTFIKPTYSIRTPCTNKWGELQEGDQHFTKFCFACKKKVYDISEMDREAVERLYQQQGGDLCVRMPIEQETFANKRFKFITHFKTGHSMGINVFCPACRKSDFSTKDIT